MDQVKPGHGAGLQTQVSQVDKEGVRMMMMMIQANIHSGNRSICETVQLGDTSPMKTKYSPGNLKKHALSSVLSTA